MAKIVLNTFGSFGDLHPYLALGLELQRRGHQPIVATSEVYRAKVCGEGLAFHPVRPDVGELLDRPDLIEKLWDTRRGTTFLIRDYLAPRINEAFDDLKPVCKTADLLLTHGASYAGPIVGELLHMRWLSVALQPAGLFSATDPLYIPELPWVRHLYRFGPFVFRTVMKLADREIRRSIKPILNLRSKLGLSANGKNPITYGQFSPCGTIALFSRAFAKPQKDWPAQTTQAGFPFFDRLGKGFDRRQKEDSKSRDGKLAAFLDAGEAPILFTLGSSAVMQAGSFYQESMQAAQALGRRAILLIGQSNRGTLPVALPSSIYVAEYLPFSEVMPRAAVIVHQGGIGTVAQSLRAGRPMLIVPWAHDQPDNAERIQRIGAGRWLPRSRYRADRAAREIEPLLRSPLFAANAQRASEVISREDGTGTACDVIEAVLG